MRKLAYFAIFGLLVFTMAAGACFAITNDELFAAIKAKDAQKVKALIAGGADVNAEAENIFGVHNITPLSYAISERNPEIAELLVENGANVNYKHPMGGGTVLSDAAQDGFTNLVKLMLEKGADPSVVDMMGFTPLQEATYFGHTDIVKLFLDRGAPVDTQDESGLTLLQYAASGAHTDLVQLLLDRGADVNHRDKKGLTPLMDAAAGTDTPIENAKLFVAKGADVNAKNNAGKTALYFAQVHVNDAMIKFLVHAGANGGKMPPPPPTSLSAADIKFLTGDCQISQADVGVIPKLEQKTQQLLIARTAMRDCKLVQALPASRDYYRKLKPDTAIPMPPAGFSVEYLTDDEFKNYQKILDSAPW